MSSPYAAMLRNLNIAGIRPERKLRKVLVIMLSILYTLEYEQAEH